MQSAVQVPLNPPYRLSRLIAETVPQVARGMGMGHGVQVLRICLAQSSAPICAHQGRAVLAFELVRPSPATTSQQLAALAKQYVSLGAEALVVRTDTEDSPEPLKDLWAVVQAVKVPVLARDFLIHPLQVRG